MRWGPGDRREKINHVSMQGKRGPFKGHRDAPGPSLPTKPDEDELKHDPSSNCGCPEESLVSISITLCSSLVLWSALPYNCNSL